MVNLTNDEWAKALKGLAEPAPTAKEYGHRGIITAQAIEDDKTRQTAVNSTADDPVPEETSK